MLTRLSYHIGRRKIDSSIIDFLFRRDCIKAEDLYPFPDQSPEEWIDHLASEGLIYPAFSQEGTLDYKVVFDSVFALWHKNKKQEVNTMKWTVEKPDDFTREIVPEDMYPAKVARVSEREMKHGMTVILDFEIAEGKHAGKIIPGFANPKLNSQTKYGNWLSAIGIDLELGKDIDESDIIGKSCRVFTETNTLTKDDGSSYESSKVIKVLPSKG
ncbi:hypothetical protein ACFLRC_02375 [Candidatus Altiarchaeota archaeon]